MSFKYYIFDIICVGQFTEGIGKSAKGVSETISETGQKLGRTEAFRTISQVMILFSMLKMLKIVKNKFLYFYSTI